MERFAECVVIIRIVASIALSRLLGGMPSLAAMNLSDLMDVLVLAACIFLIVKRFRAGCISKLVLLAVTSIVLYLSHVRTGIGSLMIDLLVVASVSFACPWRLCRAFAIGAMLSIVVVVLCSVGGVIAMRDVLPNGRLVFSYGFGHPNQLGGYMLAAIGAVTYVHWDGARWQVPFALALAASAFAKAALSSNSSAVLLAAVAAINLVGHLPLARRVSSPRRAIPMALAIAVPAALCALMLMLTAGREGMQGLASLVDRLTHSRAYFASAYYEANGGFTLLGRPLVSSSSFHSGLGFAAVDCAYSYMALVHGIAPLVAVAACYVALVLRWGRSRVHPFLFWSLMVYAAYAVVENYPLVLCANYSMLLLAASGADDSRMTRAGGRGPRGRQLRPAGSFDIIEVLIGI